MKFFFVGIAMFVGAWTVVGALAALINEVFIGRHSFVVIYLNIGVVFGSVPALWLFVRYRREARQRAGRPRF